MSHEERLKCVKAVFDLWVTKRKGVEQPNFIKRHEFETIFKMLMPQWNDRMHSEFIQSQIGSASGMFHHEFLDGLFLVRSREIVDRGSGGGEQLEAPGVLSFSNISVTEGKYILLSLAGKREGTYTFDRETGMIMDAMDGHVGTFSCNAISDVPLDKTKGDKELPCIGLCNSEVMKEIQKPSNHGAYFVLPSQLNGAEYPSDSAVVRQLEEYKFDNTGGPRGQLAAHPACGQFMLDNAAHDGNPQGINAVDTILERTAQFGFKVKNGYFDIPQIPKEKQGLAVEAIRDNLHTLRLLQMKYAPAKGLVPSKRELSDEGHTVNLVYASAVPVQAYLNTGADQEDFQTQVAAEILVAQYYGALAAAAADADDKDGSGKGTTKVYLMPLGGGVFNNPREVIFESISKAVELLSDEARQALDIKVLAWEGSKQEALEAMLLLQGFGKLICSDCRRPWTQDTRGATRHDVWYCEGCWGNMFDAIGEERINAEMVAQVINDWDPAACQGPFDLALGAEHDTYAGWTALHFLAMNNEAACDGISQIVWRQLMKAREDGILTFTGDELTPKGFTPLLQAANMLQLRGVLEILRVFSAPETFDRFFKQALPCSYSPSCERDLLKAAVNGDVELLQASVEAGARVTCKDRRGRTPVMLAILGESPDALRWLLRRGGKADSEGWHKYTPAHAAAQLDRVPCLQALEEGDPQGFAAALSTRNTAGLTPYMLAVVMGAGNAAAWLSAPERWATQEEVEEAIATVGEHAHLLKAEKLWALASGPIDRLQLYSRLVSPIPYKYSFPDEIKGTDADFGLKYVIQSEFVIDDTFCEVFVKQVLAPLIDEAKVLSERLTSDIKDFQMYSLVAMSNLPSEKGGTVSPTSKNLKRNGSRGFQLKEDVKEQAAEAMAALEEMLNQEYVQTSPVIKNAFPCFKLAGDEVSKHRQSAMERSVKLTRTAEGTFGMTVRQSEACDIAVQIESLAEGRPASDVQTGDWIVEVNGTRGSPMEISALIEGCTNQEIELVVTGIKPIKGISERRSMSQIEFHPYPKCLDPEVPGKSWEIVVALFEVGALNTLSELAEFVHGLASEFYKLSPEEQREIKFFDLFRAVSLMRWQISHAARLDTSFQQTLASDPVLSKGLVHGPVKSFPRLKHKVIAELPEELQKLAEKRTGRRGRYDVGVVAEAAKGTLAAGLDQVCDIVRALIKCDDASEFVAAIEKIMSWSFARDGKEVIRVKHGYHQDFNAHRSGGYRDVKLNVVFAGNETYEGRHIAEIQVLLSKPLMIKEYQHTLYAILRGDID
mmetsp:Transcript_47053/g.131180  ORF Transcript_47053/g.131180 Transcript_47053/m.131180 type:complete len:1287 (-) Transcript_47053:215-4075(-)